MSLKSVFCLLLFSVYCDTVVSLLAFVVGLFWVVSWCVRDYKLMVVCFSWILYGLIVMAC